MRMSQIVSGVVVLVDCFAHPYSYRSLAENGTATSLSPGGASSANLITSAWTENEHQDHGFEGDTTIMHLIRSQLPYVTRSYIS